MNEILGEYRDLVLDCCQEANAAAALVLAHRISRVERQLIEIVRMMETSRGFLDVTDQAMLAGHEAMAPKTN